MHDNFSVNLYLDNASNSTVTNNLVYSTNNEEFFRSYGEDSFAANNINISNEQYENVETPSLYYQNNNTISNNVLVGGSTGIYYGTYAGIHSDATESKKGLKNIRIVNNTVYNPAFSFVKIDEDPGIENVEISNNIFSRPERDGWITDIDSNKGLTFSHNLWHGGSQFGGTAGAEGIASSADITTNPQLKNPGGFRREDYQLQSGSSAVDAAKKLEPDTAVADGLPDMGAFEQTIATSSPSTPMPPSTPLPATPSKKLVELGWDAPSAQYYRANLDKIEDTPFEGVTVRLALETGEPVEDVFKKQAYEASVFEQDRLDLAATKSSKLTDNFLRINSATDDGWDWFSDSDWAAMEENIRNFAETAAAGDFKGFLFDPEPYGNSPWRMDNKNRDTGKSFAEYEKKVRDRGQQFMTAVQSELPSATIISLFGLRETLNEDYYPDGEADKDKADLAQGNYALLRSFIDGWMDVANPASKILDGNELSYYYKEDGDFDRNRKLLLEASDYLSPENQAKYRSGNPTAMATYIDHALDLYPGPGEVGHEEDYFQKRQPHFFKTDEERMQFLEHNVYHSLRTTDEYVWVYSQQVNWWEGDIPEGAREAVERAKEKIAKGEPLQFSVDDGGTPVGYKDGFAINIDDDFIVDVAAISDSATTTKNKPLSVNVLANDGFQNALSIDISQIPKNGTAVVDDNGTADDMSDDFVLYTPNADFVGEDTFYYTLSGSNGKNKGAVDIEVTPGSVNVPTQPPTEQPPTAELPQSVVKFTFDDIEGDSVIDSSPGGKDNSATLYGATPVDDTSLGSYVTFDGNDKIEISNSRDINLGTHRQRSVSLRFRVDDTSIDSRKQVLYEEGGGLRGLNAYVHDDKLLVGGWNTPEKESGWDGTWLETDAIASNQWHDLTIVLDGNTDVATQALTAYLDGSVFGRGEGSQLWSHPNGVALGSLEGTTKFHDGKVAGSRHGLAGAIDDVEIFNTALSESQIQLL